MYLILGCGKIGLDLANHLREQKEDVLIVDDNIDIIERLKENGFNAVSGDLNALDGSKRSEIRCILILSDDSEKNVQLAESSRARLPNLLIVALTFDPASREKINTIEHAEAIFDRGVVLSSLLGKAHEALRKSYSIMIENMLKGVNDDVVGIFIHNDPDPDALASALAFQRICDHENCRSRIYYGGEITRQENKEFVRLLGLELHHIRSIEECKQNIMDDLARIVLIETALPSENNMLPKDVVPHIVIDHHSTEENVNALEFVDIRAHIGATSTIMIQYLQELDVKMDKKLATALLYGIRTDTNGFIRNISTADLKAVAYLSPFIDRAMLKMVESPPMNPETIDIIGKAMTDRERMDDTIFSFVGYIEDRDALPQAAEFIFREKDLKAVAVCGIKGDNVYISARSTGTTVYIDKVIREAYGEMGSAGGHDTSAGAQIPLDKIQMGDKSDKELVSEIVANMMKKLFFDAMGIDITEITT